MLFFIPIFIFACDCSPSVVKNFTNARSDMIKQYQYLEKAINGLNKDLNKKIKTLIPEIKKLQENYIQTQKRTLDIYKFSFYMKQQSNFPFNDDFLKIQNLLLKEFYYER